MIFPQGVTKPFPSPSSNLLINGFLICSGPQVSVGYPFRPEDLKNLSQTPVDKDLQSGYELLSHQPGLAAIAKDRF